MGFIDYLREKELEEAKFDAKKFAMDLRKEIDKGTYWEDAFGVVEKKWKMELTSAQQNMVSKEFKKRTGFRPDNYQEE